MDKTKEYIVMLAKLMNKKIIIDSDEDPVSDSCIVYFDDVKYSYDKDFIYVHNFAYRDRIRSNYEGINFELSEEEINEKLFNCKFRYEVDFCDDYFERLSSILGKKYKFECVKKIGEEKNIYYVNNDVNIVVLPRYLRVVVEKGDVNNIVYCFNFCEDDKMYIYSPDELVRYIEDVVVKKVVNSECY